MVSLVPFYVFAAPPHPRFLESDDCNYDALFEIYQCCWWETDPADPEGIEIRMYQSCDTSGASEEGYECDEPGTFGRTKAPVETVLPEGSELLEQSPFPTPRTPGQSVLPGEGVLQQPQSEGAPLPLTRGQGVLPQDGVLQQQPTDQGASELEELQAPKVEPPAENEATQPLSEPLTNCPDGQILDEETGLCVLEETEVAEEPEAAEEPEEQPTEEEEQPSAEDENGSEDNDDNN